MADISQINLPDGSSFDVKDPIARSTKADRVPAPAEYSSSSTYALGDFCTYDGNTYVCKEAITTAEAWNADHWLLCAAQHDYLHSLDPVCNGSFSMNRFTNIYNPTGKFSSTEGYYCVASGDYSHAEGLMTRATASYAHTEGLSSMAGGMATQAHAEGYATQALGPSSHAEGCYTKARNKSQHVFGEFNVEDPAGAHVMSRGLYVEIVGNGTEVNARSNARTLDWDGNEVLAGGLKINGTQNVATQVSLTQAEYDALVQAGTVDLVNTVYFITDGNAAACSASEVTYSNASSGLTATNVQGAIDELESGKADTSSLSTVATSGSYADLSNKPLSHISNTEYYTTSTSLTYTNKSRTCPSGHTYICRVRFAWVNSKPLEMAVSLKSASWTQLVDFLSYSTISTYHTFILKGGETVYYLVKCESSGATNILYEEITDIVN